MPQYLVTFDMVDAYQRSARKSWHTVDTIADETAALAAAAALATDLANLTELDILAYTISQRVVYTDTVTAGANRDEGVTFTMRKVDNYKDDIKVPGPINSIFDAEGKVIITDAAVAAFVSNFLTGGDFVFSDDEQAIAILYGSLDK